MSDNPENRKLTAAERARIARKEQYKKAKEKQKAYLASPEVQKRLADRKEKMKELRKEKSAQKRTDAAAAKKSLAEDAKVAREKKQADRDQELLAFVRPALTLIRGGAEQ